MGWCYISFFDLIFFMKLKIAIDLDGVTIDSIVAWLEQYHPQYTKDDMYKYGVWNIVKCTEKQFFNEFDNLDPRRVKLMGGAYNCIMSIAKKHEVFFLTSKSKKSQKWSEIVLKREGLDHIPIINNWIEGRKKKDYEYDILLDDSPYNIDRRMVMFDSPWNVFEDCERVYSWVGFVQYLNTL